MANGEKQQRAGSVTRDFQTGVMNDRQFSLDRNVKTCRRDSNRVSNNEGEGYDESWWQWWAKFL